MTDTTAHTLVERARTWNAELAPERAETLVAYLDAMLQLNEQINLTAIRERDQALVLHAMDGLAFAATGLRPRHVLDIGSGNGFPGVAIAALHPGATVLLLDRTGKKVRAIGSCLVAARLDGVETLQMDAAQAPALRPEMRHAFDLVTARAVGTPEMLGELAEPLTRPGGDLVIWLDADAAIPERLGAFKLVRRVDYELPAPAARTRRLAQWRKRG